VPPHLPRAASHLKTLSSSFFVLTLASILIGLTSIGALASEEDPIVIPILAIQPTAQSFDINTSPSFNITTPAGADFVVQFTLAKKFFSGDQSLDGYLEMSGDKQNFYSYTGYTSTGTATVSIPLAEWKNLHGSVVFYRLYSLAANGGNTTPNSSWKNAPSIRRTGESWVGMPLNDRAMIGSTQVVINGKLNSTAISSDFGPRIASGGSRFHAGLDIPVSVGTPVYAIADGTVISSSEHSSDHIMMIQHDGSRKVGYVHLDAWLVDVGQTVVKGELIAYSGDWVGNTHASPHLHIDSGYANVGSDQNAYGAIFYNPLHYLPYTNNYSEGIRFLHDSYTRSRPIDIEPAAGNQDKVLVAFGLTTEHDKDLNYVKVQVNGSTAVGQYFVLNYDEVVSQDSSTGVVTLSNGRTFRVRPLNEDIYSDTNLSYDYYVKPGSTNVNVIATDYFFFPWDMTPFRNGEDDGPQDIVITAQEVNGASHQWPKTIGPEIQPVSSEVNGKVLTANINLIYHDVMSGSLRMEAKGVPAGWTANFDRQVLSMAPEANATVTLTLTSPDVISPDLMESNHTRVVATFERISVLQDTEVLCPASGEMPSVYSASTNGSAASGLLCPLPPGKAEITQPPAGQVIQGAIIQVIVNKAGAKSGTQNKLIVENENNGSVKELSSVYGSGDELFFNWTPDEAATTYVLTAQVEGLYDSDPVRVWTAGGLRFIQPSGSTVDMNQPITVKVEAEGMDQVLLSINPDGGGGGGWMTETSANIWSWSPWKPLTAGQEYTLRATGYPSNNGNTVTTYHYVTALPSQPTIEVTNPIALNKATTVKVTAPGSNDVDLVASGAVTMTKSGYSEATQQGDGIWHFEWTPNIAGPQSLTAHVYYAFQSSKMISKEVEVIDDGSNFFEVEAKNDSLVDRGAGSTATISSGRVQKKVELVVIDPDGNEEDRISFDQSEKCTQIPEDQWDSTSSSTGLLWSPDKLGIYTLIGHVWDCDNHHGWTEPGIQVTALEPGPAGAITRINDWAFLWENNKPIKSLFEGYGSISDPVYANTEIPVANYVCGIVGIHAYSGDIGEERDNDRIIQAYLTTWHKDNYKNWQIMLDFNTWNLEGVFNDLTNKPEYWNVKLMCFDRKVAAYGGPENGKPIFIKEFDNKGDDINVSTGISASQYACGIGGFDSDRGDIQENGVGDIIFNNLYIKDGLWWMQSDFRTHNSSLENWDHDLLCVDRSWAALNTPETGKPFVFISYGSLGDNVDKLTEFRTDEWTCGIVGFAALHGDIDEKESNNALILAQMNKDNAAIKWRIRADFRTHNDHESWNVNVMCVAKEGVSIQSVQPYLFTGAHPDESLYGPGMKIDFTDSHDPDATHYRVQYSSDGGATWNNIYTTPRKLSDGSWFNHHGSYECGWEAGAGGAYETKYGHCLPAKTTYLYRVGLLASEAAQEPINGKWSEPISAVSYDWPAYFELVVKAESGPDPDHAYYRLDVTNMHGPNLDMEWELQSVLGAAYRKIGGCGSGTYQDDPSSRYCRIEVYSPQGASTNSVITVASEEPSPGISVIVTGTDKYYQDGIYLSHTYHEATLLKADNDDGDGQDDNDNRITFVDVQPDHWAYTYVEYLSDLHITSGCTTVGDPQYCPANPLSRAQMAVFTVRSRHLQEPGYVPPSPPGVVFIDEEAQPLLSLASTSSDPVYRAEIYWYDKYSQELYDDGVISGCSSNPLKFCPNDSTTRAQMTVFIVRLLHGENFTPYEPNQQLYRDVPLVNSQGAAIWFAKWIAQAHQDGLIQACGTDMANLLFRPEEAVTRAEAACMMYFALEAKGE